MKCASSYSRFRKQLDHSWNFANVCSSVLHLSNLGKDRKRKPFVFQLEKTAFVHSRFFVTSQSHW